MPDFITDKDSIQSYMYEFQTKRIYNDTLEMQKFYQLLGVISKF